VQRRYRIVVIGLERGVARLVPYSPQWPELYAREERLFRALIGPYVLDIRHIGSTAIPGMIAKPILDIRVAIEQFEEGTRRIGPIESLATTTVQTAAQALYARNGYAAVGRDRYGPFELISYEKELLPSSSPRSGSAV
jgi:GrpB-like predicted nucleotidyltransferase (UPF0157 family)